ncbi:SERTA domain-containing protein 3 [Antennarius striatus]|uniref:SERTA domain-containing protein 3 n=1 Tax=Antennarius striatus TaxID=241820 RepID=UPI0035B04DB2
MIMKGQKRKFSLEEVDVSDWDSSFWESQRQFVFSVSLSKYQRGQELPEPSLRRSVLIANTLRQVSLEACSMPSVEIETSQPHWSSSPQLQESSPPTAEKHPSTAMFADSISPPSSCTPVCSDFAASRSPTCGYSSASNTLSEKDNEDWGLMSVDSDFTLSATITSVLTALDATIDGSPQSTSRTPLRSLENLSEIPGGGATCVKEGVSGHGGSWEQQQESRVWDSSIDMMKSSYLSDLTVEDLFQDIDTSLMERDITAMGVRGSGNGCTTGDDFLLYLPPFSSTYSHTLSLNQNVKTLPSFSSFSSSSSLPLPSSSSSLSSPSSSSQTHVREGFDLEHLVKILVES